MTTRSDPPSSSTPPSPPPPAPGPAAPPQHATVTWVFHPRVDLERALLDHDAQRLRDLALPRVRPAHHHDAHPLSRLHTVP